MNSNIPLEHFTVAGSFDLDEIKACLCQYGIAVAPGLIQGEDLEQARVEWDKMRSPEFRETKGLRHVGGDIADYVALDRDVVENTPFPAIDRIFGDEKMRMLANAVVGQPNMFNTEVYATYDIGKDAVIAATHFDKSWNLKFMLYLEDNLESGGGAFGVHPSSMHAARLKFRQWFDGIADDGYVEVGTEKFYTMPNENLPEDLHPLVEILAPAGTMIVFSTDLFHRASYLRKGRDRKILRAHTHPGPCLLGLGDKISRTSRYYDRGETWERTGAALIDPPAAIVPAARNSNAALAPSTTDKPSPFRRLLACLAR